MSAEPTGRGMDLLAVLATHGGRVRRYLSRRLRRPQDIDDVVQEIWLRLLRHDPTAIHDPLAYLLRVAHNVAADFSAQEIAERRHVMTSSDELGRMAETTEEPSTANLAERLMEQREIEQAMAELPETQAQVLRLHEMQGLSYSEVATTLNLSVHTVEKYLVKAKAFLRMRLIK